MAHRGGRIEFNISSVCCKFFASSGCNLFGCVATGKPVSPGVGEEALRPLA